MGWTKGRREPAGIPTGRDGVGAATGISSKAGRESSLTSGEESAGVGLLDGLRSFRSLERERERDLDRRLRLGEGREREDGCGSDCSC